MIIVDTTVWIDYFGETSTLQTAWLEYALNETRIGLTDLNLCEILQGIRNDRQFNSVRQEMLKFEVFPTGGIDLATESARNYRTLRAQGVTIRKTIDCLIATFCLQNGHSLLHNDRDFDPFENFLNLHVIHP